ncbi:MAG: glycosyltransferase family 4 protein [Candidatus Cloacimonetes bacterium]|nr:glycosyltransferase family 4 protein [Candidatus Cloacimonadota bacterium]
MKTILFYPAKSTFIDVDIKILSEISHLQTMCLHQNNGRLCYFFSLLGIIPKIALFPQHKICISWFADYHALFIVLGSRLFNRKSVLFIGGYDAVHYPKLSYGVFHNRLRKLCAVYALKHCDLIIANHNALLSSNNKYYNPHGHSEGVYRLVKNLHTKSIVIHNCITIPAPHIVSKIRKKQILCVGTTPRLQDFYNKGFDLLMEAVIGFRDWHFVFVGIKTTWQKILEPDFHFSHYQNLTIHASIPHPELLSIMSESDIVVQISISEGMPNSLMEAMLYGCKAVGSYVAGIPTIIGNMGEIITERKAEALLKALRKTMQTETDRQSISNWIANSFPYETRKSKLENALKDLA